MESGRGNAAKSFNMKNQEKIPCVASKYIYITGTKRYSTILSKINKENVV